MMTVVTSFRFNDKQSTLSTVWYGVFGLSLW